MLILFVAFFISTLNSAVGVERHFLTPRFVKSKRAIVETGHNVPQGYKSHQFQPDGPYVRSIETSNPKPVSHKGAKIIKESSLIGAAGTPVYSGVFKQSPPYSRLPFESQNTKQLLPYSDNLFTISAGYKVAGDNFPKPFKQHGVHSQPKFHQNVAAVSNHHLPVYKTAYPLSKTAESQMYAPTFQNKKASLPTFQVQKSQGPPHLSGFQSQPLVLNPVEHQFNFAVRTPKTNNVQPSAPFLSPLSSFQGQVVPISTVANNAQFPQYKGATVEVYPTVGGFPMIAYQPLQTQPQLLFGQDHVQSVQPVDNPRHPEEIRSDVEIIDKKKPAPPPKDDGGDDNDDNDDDDDDEGYGSPEKQYGANSEDDDDYELKPEKYFKTPPTEGNFKPSTSFPFKQYDEKFGKYSNRHRGGESDEKPGSKYQDYPSSSNHDNDEQAPSAKYHSEDTSSKPFYNRQMEEEESDDKHSYERQRSEGTSVDVNTPKYLEKDSDEEFEASYRAEPPKQKYVHVKEVPEVEYESRSPKVSNYESDDPTIEATGNKFRYYKDPRDFKDVDGYSSDVVTSLIPGTLYQGTFGYKIP
ncbi:PREDICTED: uncharacterized protein LOC108548422 [Eufriesea mexicana]|uniref:uncharacterized protein LOC108548422 n=1 Tax=Eufriesea mexicana TaxID=516756 RepID=UPI00083BB9F1|nr:PREDICTED: uncharacterized protein LOC108548422 [Eufriesea mexicana]